MSRSGIVRESRKEMGRESQVPSGSLHQVRNAAHHSPVVHLLHLLPKLLEVADKHAVAQEHSIC